MSFLIGNFGGENRKVSPFLLGAGQAEEAVNIDFRSGRAEPFLAPLLVKTMPANTQSIAFYKGEPLGFGFDADFASIQTGEETERLLIASNAAPAYWDGAQKRLGSRQPLQPPQVAKTGTIITPDPTTNPPLDYYFAYTYQNEFGAESPLSPPPAGQTQYERYQFPANQDVKITCTIDPQAQGEKNLGAGKINIYRTSDTTGEWQRIASVDVDFSVLDGSAAKAEEIDIPKAGEVETLIYAQFVAEETIPPDGLRGVLVHPKGFAAGYYYDAQQQKSYVCFSETLELGIWPASWRVWIPEGRILAIAEWNGDIYVFPANSAPRRIRLDGPQPGLRVLPVPMETNYPCLVGKSVVNMGAQGLWYASAEGIVALPSGELITRDIFSGRGDNAFTPPRLAFRRADEYFAAYAGEVLYLTLRGVPGGVLQAARITTDNISAAQTDNRGRAFVVRNANLMEFGANENEPLEILWRSPKRRLTDQGDIGLLWFQGGRVPGTSGVVNGQPRKNFTPIIAFSNDNPVAASPLADFAADGSGIFRPPLQETNFLQDPSTTFRIITDADQAGDNEEIIIFPQDRNPRDVYTPEFCDLATHLRRRRVVSWVQVEVRTNRAIDYIGLFSDMDHFLDLKDGLLRFLGLN